MTGGGPKSPRGGLPFPRKVRAPQGEMPDNVRAPSPKGGGDRQRNRKDTAPSGVRVKWRGKSSPRAR